jgi:hypothetical protein
MKSNSLSAPVHRVLIGMLRTDEQEYHASVAMLEAQTYQRWDRVEIRNQPNRQAHEALYSLFMARASDFDLFVKLDADMVFRRRDSLESLVKYMEAHPDVDHAQFVVSDWLSGQLIEGLNVFTPRVRWTFGSEELFTDTTPAVMGRAVTVWSAPAPFVDHAPDPSLHQAFSTGIHRALKAVQFGRPAYNWRRGMRQLRYLFGVRARYLAMGDPRMLVALYGASLVVTRSISTDGTSYKHFKFEHLEVELIEVERAADRFWGVATIAFARIALAIGIRRFVWAAIRSSMSALLRPARETAAHRETPSNHNASTTQVR